MEVDVKYKDIFNKIKGYENGGALNAALKICERREYLRVPVIQSERLFILMKKMGNYEMAYQLFKTISYMKEPYIQSKGVEILSKLSRYKELNELIMDNADIEDVRYNIAVLKHYMEVKDYTRALEICENPLYSNEKTIIGIKNKIERELKKIDNDGVSEVLIRLYADDITPTEIEENNLLKEFHKVILNLAYYEKHNPKKGIELCKNAKKNPNFNNEQIKILNNILEHLISKKKKFYDILLYANLLNRYFDLEKAQEYILEKKDKEEFKELVQSLKEVNIPKKEEIKIIEEKSVTSEKPRKKKKVFVGTTGVSVNNRYSNNSNINTPIHTPSKKEILIKDVLGDEIDNLQKYLYCLMQDYSYYIDANDTWKQVSDVACKLITKRSPYTEPEKELLKQSFNKMQSDYDYYKRVVKAWDYVEIFSTKPISDRKALSRIINVLLKVNERHPEIIEADTSKLVKLLNK